MPFHNPSQAEQNDFLIRLYFGQREPLTACVDRAYLDFSRTLHGMAHLADAASVPRKGGEFVSSWLTHLRDPRGAWDLDSFDAHHRNACERLCELYAAHGFDCFVVGQAQKWLNMSLKYVFVFGEQRLSGFARSYPLGHVPIDNIILARLSEYHAPRLSSSSWSRLNEYGEYLSFQQWVRHRFPECAPLAVEFHLWRPSNEVQGARSNKRLQPTAPGTFMKRRG